MSGQTNVDDSVDDIEEGVGCAPLGAAATALLLVAAVLWTAGILLEDPGRCSGWCENAAFALIFAGTPVSALVTVLGALLSSEGDLVLAYPVDALIWLLIAVVHTKLSGEAMPFSRRWVRTTAAIVAVALIYGAVLSLLIERA
jgi:hypothetical protein